MKDEKGRWKSKNSEILMLLKRRVEILILDSKSRHRLKFSSNFQIYRGNKLE